MVFYLTLYDEYDGVYNYCYKVYHWIKVTDFDNDCFS